MDDFTVLPGDPRSPVVLHVPHAATRIPPDVRRGIRLDDAGLATELALLTDAHTDLIAARAAALADVRPFRFVNRTSRLVVDPERFPDAREEMAAVGMAAVYTRTTSGAPLRDDDPSLLERYYHPYAAAMTSTVDERLAVTGAAVVVDVHSYPARALPYELHGDGPRPAVCLGTDPFHTPAGLVDAALEAFAGVGDVALDTPFAGCYVPLKHFRREPAVRAIMIELRRDRYLRGPGGDPTAGLETVAAALARLVSSTAAR